MDTIFALATSHGRAGVAVVRVSGDRAWEAASVLVGNLPKQRVMAIRVVHDEHGSAIDEALIVTFEAGNSFTGERVVELHLHGSNAVVAAVLELLGQQPHLRLALPGEFTRRAMDNGRLDLAQVEGLADLIDAETEVQRRQALKVMRGSLSDKAAGWRAALIRAVSLVEVTIDFVDEEVPVDVSPEVLELLSKVSSEIQLEAQGGVISERIHSGFEVAIIGKPNIGKSTLLNVLAGRDAAITSEIAGTTRDVIEVQMNLAGLAVTLLDTAGIRASDDTIEVMGVERAKERAEEADIRIVLLGEGDFSEEMGVQIQSTDIILRGKSDVFSSDGASISGKTGAGVDELIERVSAELSKRASGATSVIRLRHRIALEKALVALDSAQGRVADGMEWADIAAEEIRRGIRELDLLIGRVDVENILDEIFSSFCLGK